MGKSSDGLTKEMSTPARPSKLTLEGYRACSSAVGSTFGLDSLKEKGSTSSEGFNVGDGHGMRTLNGSLPPDS